MSEWQDISTAPKDGTCILVTNEDAGGAWVVGFKERYQSGMRCENPWMSRMLNHWHLPNQGASRAPTHWMPLPRPPALPDEEG